VKARAGRPAAGRALGANEIALSPDLLRETGLEIGQAAHLTSGSSSAYARISDATGRPDEGTVSLGRLLWPALRIRPGEPLEIEPAALQPAQRVVITPPAEIHHHLADRIVDGLRQAKTALYPGARIYVEAYQGNQGLTVMVEEAEPTPAYLGEETSPEWMTANEELANPAASYSDIGGLGNVIERLHRLVELPLLRPEVYRRAGAKPPRGVLLYGPPGTGKTLLGRSAAAEIGINTIVTAATALVGSYQGETESNLRLLFSEALSKAPTLIVFDEFDVIGTNRDRLASMNDVRAATQLLSLMDGLVQIDGILVLANSNRIDAIDPAFRRPGRFDEELYIGPPTAAGRTEILSIHTRDMPLSRPAEQALEAVAREAVGFVGADLMQLAREAALRAMVRWEDESRAVGPDATVGDMVVKASDLQAALENATPSLLRGAETPPVTIVWEEIAQEPRVMDAIDQAAREQIDKAAGRQGILIFGAPGTGKSTLANALASHLNANFVSIEGLGVFNQWLGESEQAIRATFRRASEVKPSVVVLDHLEAIAPLAEASDSAGERIKSALLSSVDRALAEGGIAVIGVTTRPELVDPRLIRPGRLGVHLELALPRKEVRADLVRRMAGDQIDLDDAIVERIAAGTEGWSNVEIATALGNAIEAAHRDGRGIAIADIQAGPRKLA
jgi:transitional endoplasmic reticulum ATPase